MLRVYGAHEIYPMAAVTKWRPTDKFYLARRQEKKKVKIDDKIHLFLPVEADIILVVKHI